MEYIRVTDKAIDEVIDLAATEDVLKGIALTILNTP